MQHTQLSNIYDVPGISATMRLFLRRTFAGSVLYSSLYKQRHCSINFQMMVERKPHKKNQPQKPLKKSFYLKQEDKELLAMIKALLEANPGLHLTIPQLSKKALLNEFKLKKGFRHLYGTSIYDFHLNIRMNEAKRLLLETNETLEEIARQIGYHYPSTFIAAFRKMYKITPATFRRNCVQ